MDVGEIDALQAYIFVYAEFYMFMQSSWQSEPKPLVAVGAPSILRSENELSFKLASLIYFDTVTYIR